MEHIAKQVMTAVAHLNPTLTIAPTGSIYIYVTGQKVKQIRLADHGGHTPKRGSWEIRSDAMTKRNVSTRVYHTSSLNACLRDLEGLK
ncbi:hypothetical protein VPHD479_0306 [Vibrio phage D479]